MPGPTESAELSRQVEVVLERHPDRPYCVHGLFEELLAPLARGNRDQLLDATRHAADEAVSRGRARMEFVSAIAIGVHCEDVMYWSIRSPKLHLKDFGPEYESPTILSRLGAHITCHGL
jgi:hypothetical protein